MKLTRTMQELSQEEFNNLIKKLARTHYVIVAPKKGKSSRAVVYVNVDRTKVYLTYRDKTCIKRFFTRLDSDSNDVYYTPVQVWAELIKICGKENIPDLREKYGYKLIKYGSKGNSKVQWDITCPGGYHYHDPNKINIRFENCYGYDINSSYSYAMTKDMPDTSVPPRLYSKVEKGEIGFLKNGEVCFEGFAEYIFPLIKSPFKPFIDKYYDLKVKYSNDKKKKAKYKQILNIPTGYVQRLNPFLRNAIIYYAKEYVKQYIDENTLYVNTDSIISLTERPDIPLHDTELGKFKCDHRGTFMYWAQGCYEWNGEKHNQGIPQYMLNNDGIMKYRFDEEKMEVVENGEINE